MEFQIEIPHGAYRYRFQLVQGKPLKGFELFTLTGGDKKVVLQSNRPMLLGRGLKKKPIHWKVEEGAVNDQKALDKVTAAIERYLKEQEEAKQPAKPVQKVVPCNPPVNVKSRKEQAKLAPKIPWGERVKKE